MVVQLPDAIHRCSAVVCESSKVNDVGAKRGHARGSKHTLKVLLAQNWHLELQAWCQQGLYLLPSLLHDVCPELLLYAFPLLWGEGEHHSQMHCLDAVLQVYGCQRDQQRLCTAHAR